MANFTQSKPLLLLLAFTIPLSYRLSVPILPACSCHCLIPVLVNMSILWLFKATFLDCALKLFLLCTTISLLCFFLDSSHHFNT